MINSRAREQRLHLALEAAPIAMLMIDQEGKIVFVNRQVERLFGYGPSELLGQTIEILVPERSRRRHAMDRETFQHKPVARPMGAGRDLHGLRKDGTEVPVEIGLIPIKSEDGEFVIAGVVDISARKQLESKLNQVNSDLERRVSELEEFSYTVSHDLRAPLRHIEGYIQLLRRRIGGKLGVETEDILDRIAAAASKMDQLTQDVLIFSKAGREFPALEQVPLDELVPELIARYPECQGADIKIVQPLLCVLANLSLVSQIVSNLIGNAVKFVPARRKPVIEISTERRKEWVRLWFKDNGIGIDPRLHQKIFKAFERAPEAKDYPGTGIGLAIVKKAVERMGGRVGVESIPGNGSRFWIDLKGGLNHGKSHFSSGR